MSPNDVCNKASVAGRFALKVLRLFSKRVSLPIGILIFAVVGFLLLFRLGARFVRDDSLAFSGAKSLGITEMIQAVKEELQAAEVQTDRSHEAALFSVQTFDMEISFVARSSSNAKGGFQYQVLTIETERGVSSERVQKLNLHFTAIPPKVIDLLPSEPETDKRPVVIRGPTPPPKKGESK